LAGPEVFLPQATALRVAAEKKRLCEQHGLVGVFPFDLEVDGTGCSGPEIAAKIHEKDELMMDTCALCIANLTPFRGVSGDSGTCFEAGYMRAQGKPVFTYTNDRRQYKDRAIDPGASDLGTSDPVDIDNMNVEDFGGSENLMLSGGATASGGSVIVTQDTVPTSELFTSLAAFERAVVAAASLVVRPLPEAEQHERFMRMAIAEAEESVKAGNHPFGAVLASEDSSILLRAQNTVNTDGGDVTRHAELNLVSQASRSLTREQLQACTLYSSTVPCPMCSGAIYWAGIGRVVFGCSARLLEEIAGDEIRVSASLILKSGVSHQVPVLGPVLEAECAQQHRDYWPKLAAK